KTSPAGCLAYDERTSAKRKRPRESLSLQMRRSCSAAIAPEPLSSMIGRHEKNTKRPAGIPAAQIVARYPKATGNTAPHSRQSSLRQNRHCLNVQKPTSRALQVREAERPRVNTTPVRSMMYEATMR